MDTIMSRSKGKVHPFSTKIGNLIKKATDCSLNQEDWSLFLQICDIVNKSEEKSKQAFAALRLRLSSSIGKSQETVWLTLLLLEVMVKNGNNNIHLMVLNKDCLSDLNKILLPKYQAPVSHQNKVLQMFEDWIKTLAGVPGYKDLYKIYRNLKDKRIYDLTDQSSETRDSFSTISRSGEDFNSSSRGSIFRKKSVNDISQIDTLGCVLCSSVKKAKNKLLSELDLVKESADILNEMIHEIHPASMEVKEATMIGDLYRTCQEMFKRLTKLAGRPNLWEDTTERILELIDSMNQTFASYDEFIERVSNENEVLLDVIMCEDNESELAGDCKKVSLK